MRIDHIEDIIFLEGSDGVSTICKTFLGLEKDGYKNVSVKWDGAPCIIFGKRNNEFICTDKHGFFAKTYNGKCKSELELRSMLYSRRKDITSNYESHISNMIRVYKTLKYSIIKDGFFKCDLLYAKCPEIKDSDYIFKPNIVSYSVDKNSKLGKDIGRSNIGLVLHSMLDINGNEYKLPTHDIFTGTDVMRIFPTNLKTPVKIDHVILNKINMLNKIHGKDINWFLDTNRLSDLKIKNLPDIFYKYINYKVDVGMKILGCDFNEWVENNDKITSSKKKNIKSYITYNKKTFDVIWDIINYTVSLKENVIFQMDKQRYPMKSYIGELEGGEGYVLRENRKIIKLVSRQKFSAVNRKESKYNK